MKKLKNKEAYLLFTKDTGYGKKIIERIPSFPCELYYTYIKLGKHVAYKIIFQNVNTSHTWHDLLITLVILVHG
jgi:hypothetical protein